MRAIILVLLVVAVQARSQTPPEKADEAAPNIQQPTKAPTVEWKEPAKPKANGSIPEGWRVLVIPDAKIESDPILLAPGLTRKIIVSPYRLVPDSAKGRYAIEEPGFDPAQGTTQANTLAAILSRHTDQITDTQKTLDQVIATLDSAINAAQAQAGDQARLKPHFHKPVIQDRTRPATAAGQVKAKGTPQ